VKVINRKAHFDYELGERIEAGIQLTGGEVKSVKLGQVDMGNAYVKIREGEAFIIGLHIYPYKFANNTDYDAQRTRKLLLNKQELEALALKMKQARLVIVPMAMYTKHGRVKAELALARGKRMYEKRETIKKRDLERELY
jgi:SsrA-binding protein